MNDSKKKPNPIDIHVGSRIRLRRNMVGMSQERLGEKLGITFQQIQKYEKGTNRVGASRLQNISSILNVPVSFFFEDAPGGAKVEGLSEESATTYVVDFLSSTEGLRLNRAFVRISDPKVRSRIIDLVRALADVCRQRARGDDLVARLGREEFAVLLSRRDARQCTLFADDLVRAARAAPARLSGGTIHFSVSVGVAQARAGESFAVLVRRGEDALRAARQRGRDQWARDH